ncbi:MAG: MFS transporter, partial [Alistipes sp.]|nr:MFS transporter [Alistipes sp.]
FWIPSGIAFAGAVGLALFLRDTPTSVGLPELAGTETRREKSATESAEHKAFLMKHVFRNPMIWILGFANFFVYIVRFSVLDWGPSLLSQSKGVSMSHAGWLVAMFEIAGILGMLFSGWATDRWFGGRAPRMCVFCMAGAALFVFAFWQLPSATPVWLLSATLCAAGFCIYGPQALIGIAAANQATKRAAATAIGLTGLFGYASTLVSGVGLGYVAQHFGWNWAYAGILGMAVTGMLIFLATWGARADGYEPDAE